MDLSVRDLVRLFQVSEKTIYRWIKEKELPTYKVHDQYRFSRSTLLEWARSQRIAIPPEAFQEEFERGEVSLSQAIVQGGIHYQVSGKTREEVICSIARLPKLPLGLTAEDLASLLLARESLSSTGIGQGIAIPHVKDPIVLPIKVPSVSVCFLEKPINFEAIDGAPVHTFFLLLSPTIRDHLRLLSKIAFIIHDPVVLGMMIQRESQERLLTKINAVEANLPKEPKR
ncbi:MAG: PTS sugar transporter subunit IIA [Deltaproteobacteria bacterium]|nr:PTS sugar transporter subunit IIA [Deltaproteobacteria bacterium]MBI2499999.1 PTS sugar transporter subunit IIA [Deltaproteobacteria bacterium]MBI4196833.1 PTS sugar transporter subunit IIA [Deltaproteobacteria bacterium]